MKLQNLTVIFVIIIIPVILLVSLYITNGLKTIKYQAIYDSGLLTATHDAINAFELNTTNDAYSDNAETKRNILKSSVNAFERSLCNTCGISSFNTSEIEEYIPAIMFGMYDGFYLYAPSLNSSGKYEHSLKNYVYYSENVNNIIITYSLDSYITVSGYFDGNYVTKEGYLMVLDGSESNGTKYKGIDIDTSDTDAIKYYKEACEFTKWFNEKVGGKKSYLYIDKDNDPEYENSAFTQNKRKVMKNKIEQVLNSTITAYSNRTTTTNVYKMPKLNSYDWEKIYSNISMVTFFQGKNIGLTNYNGYCVLNSTNSNEYVNPNLMYFINDGKYHDIRCTDIKDINSYSEGYRIGNFKKKKTTTESGETSYIYEHNENACYNCINGQISNSSSIYEYVRSDETNVEIKKSYFTSLARERYNTVKLLKINKQNNILKDNLNIILSETENKKLYDDYGNRITVPAGFKVVVDSTTSYNTNNIDVTKGIVIEDANGNQFVWIPVGTIYTDTAQTEEKAKKIILGRYKDFTKNSEGEYMPVQISTNYAERKDINLTAPEGDKNITCYEDSSNNDTKEHYNAKDLRAFCLNSNQNGGYYLGRYEAVKNTDGKVILKEIKTNEYKTYTGLGQPNASKKCREMYSSNKFETDLTNSYAYDTALIFIQEFGQSNYATNKKTFEKNTYDDKQLNIYNMNGGYIEWSTEISTDSNRKWIKRGTISYIYGNEVDVSSRRCDYKILTGYSFRPILYLK